MGEEAGVKRKREEMKGDTGKEKVRGENKNKMRGEIVAGSDAGGWRRGGEEGGRRPARRPQGLLGRGQPISLSLINSSRGDCNTAGDCWEKGKKKKKMEGGGRERDRNEWEGVEWSGGGPQDEGKIGKTEGKWGRGEREEERGGEGLKTKGEDGRLDEIQGRKLRGG